MKERIIKEYKILKHNIEYKDKYFKKGIISMIILLIIDGILLYMVW